MHTGLGDEVGGVRVPPRPNFHVGMDMEVHRDGKIPGKSQHAFGRAERITTRKPGALRTEEEAARVQKPPSADVAVMGSLKPQTAGLLDQACTDAVGLLDR